MENYFYITPEDYMEAEKNGINAKVVYDRVYLGWNKKRAITEPVQKRRLTQDHFKIASKNGIPENTVKHRVSKLKWDIEKAITVKPIKKKNKYLDLARQNGIKESTFWSRVNQGWTQEKASTTPVLSRKQCMQRALTVRHEKEISII